MKLKTLAILAVTLSCLSLVTAFSGCSGSTQETAPASSPAATPEGLQSPLASPSPGTPPADSPEVQPQTGAAPVPAPSPNLVHFVTPAEVKRMMEAKKQFILVDVRTDAEYTRGHLQSAISVPIERLAELLTQIPHGPEVIVYTGCA